MLRSGWGPDCVHLPGRPAGYPGWVRRGPLAHSYLGAVGLVGFSLIPYLALVVGVFPLSKTIAASLGLSSSALDVTIALSTGAYAAGTVVAVQFAVHLPARRMLVLYEVIFVVASILAASARWGRVHGRLRHPGLLYQPDADRRGPDAGHGLATEENADHGCRDESVHFRGGGGRADPRISAAHPGRLASTVLGGCRTRPCGSGLFAAHL